MHPVMYLFANSELGMSPAKLGAQLAHAAVEAYQLSADPVSLNPQDNPLIQEWYKGGHYKKVVLDGGDSEQIKTIERYLNDRNFRTALIIDEGRTEIAPFQVTALGVSVVDKDDPHTAATFGSFKTLREKKPEPWYPLLERQPKSWREMLWPFW